MSEKKHLKIIQPGFEKYTGPIGVYEFVDGFSVEPVPRHERDRISVSMSMVEVSENGKEVVAGIAERLVTEAGQRAPKLEALEVQTPEQKSQEKDIEQQRHDAQVQIYSVDEIDAKIEADGITGLRQIAEPWGLKHRAIHVLRQMLIDAQNNWIEERDYRIEQRKQKIEATQKPDGSEKTHEAAQAGEDDISRAAASGDMSAAVNAAQGGQ